MTKETKYQTEPLIINTYEKADQVGYVRTIETRDWIIYENLDGNLHIHTSREPTGGVKDAGVILQVKKHS